MSSKLIIFSACALLGIGLVVATKAYKRYTFKFDEDEDDDEDDCTLIYNRKKRHAPPLIGVDYGMEPGCQAPVQLFVQPPIRFIDTGGHLDISGIERKISFEPHSIAKEAQNKTVELIHETNAAKLSGCNDTTALFSPSKDDSVTPKYFDEDIAGGNYFVPDEIYLHVFSYLSASALTSTVQKVCKDWHRLVDDHALWRALVDDLCNEQGVPFNLCAGAVDSEFSLARLDEASFKSNTWKQRYFVASLLNAKNEVHERWRLWLDVLLESSTHAMILGHDFQVCAVSSSLKPSVVDLDDIFKGVGVKGSFPIPRVVHIGMKSFTVLSTMPHNWSLGFWIIARDLRTDTGLVIVKTRKLVLISIKERCDFCGQIQMVQGTLRVAELLLYEDY